MKHFCEHYLSQAAAGWTMTLLVQEINLAFIQACTHNNEVKDTHDKCFSCIHMNSVSSCV